MAPRHSCLARHRQANNYENRNAPDHFFIVKKASSATEAVILQAIEKRFLGDFSPMRFMCCPPPPLDGGEGTR